MGIIGTGLCLVGAGFCLRIGYYAGERTVIQAHARAVEYYHTTDFKAVGKKCLDQTKKTVNEGIEWARKKTHTNPFINL